jgi:hypothetical protein
MNQISKVFTLLIVIIVFNHVQSHLTPKDVQFIKTSSLMDHYENVFKVKLESEDYSQALEEERLLRYLFKDYNPHIIPRESNNESLKLYIGLAMIQLINIFDKEQVMKTNVWVHMVI